MSSQLKTAAHRILVVDDTEEARYAMVRLLTRADFQVLEARTGTEAIEVATKRPDLIILDVQLPDINGIEVSRLLRENPATSDIPILQFSASFTLTTHKIQGLDAGADVYLATPVDSGELLAHVRTLLRLKETQDTLRQSEQRYRSLVEATTLIVWTTNPRGEIETENGSWQAFTGQTAEECAGFGWMSAIRPEHRQQVAEAWQQSSQARRLYQTEYDLRRYDGAWRRVLARGVPVFNSDGSLREYVGTCNDITERKRAEQALVESEQRFRLMADGTPVTIWVTDQRGTVEFVNRAYCDFFGYSAEQLKAGGWTHLVHPEDAPRYVNLFQDAIRNKSEFRTSARVRRHDGAWRVIETHALPRVSETGECLGMVGSSVDVTERTEFEKELERKVAERTHSLEETTKQLNDFCYSIAHDLKAPIRAQAAFAHTLLEDFSSCLGAEGSAFARQIRDSAERQNKLVTDLLAHISLGQSELPLETVDLPTMVGTVQQDFTTEMQEKKANVDFSRVSGHVLANPASLHLVLANLLSNALKFQVPERTPDVRVWTEPVALREPKPIPGADHLRLCVQDNGIGIPEKHRHKLFGVFQRLHTREQFPGTGIGLALVKRAVERMGGQVGFESTEGQGSRFWVDLRVPGGE